MSIAALDSGSLMDKAVLVSGLCYPRQSDLPLQGVLEVYRSQGSRRKMVSLPRVITHLRVPFSLIQEARALGFNHALGALCDRRVHCLAPGTCQ